jgi:hypothetical protein
MGITYKAFDHILNEEIKGIVVYAHSVVAENIRTVGRFSFGYDVQWR